MTIRLHDCKTELKYHELKVTPARIAILKLLEETDKPLDIQAVISSLKAQNIKADPVTVFRIMNVFTDKGLAKRIQLQEGKFRYELSAKPDHHHLVCSDCGSIADMSDCSLNQLIADIQKKKRFIIKSHSLEFYGLCANCQR